MKIVLIVHQYLPKYYAGTENLTYQMANELSKKGHEVAIITGEPDFQNSEKLFSKEAIVDIYNDVTVLRLKMYGNYWRNSHLDYQEPPYQEEIINFLKNFNPDVVHINHSLFISVRIIESIKNLNIPVIYSSTDFWLVCPTGQLLKWNNELCKGPSLLHCIGCTSGFKAPANKNKVLSYFYLLHFLLKKTISLGIRVSAKLFELIALRIFLKFCLIIFTIILVVHYFNYIQKMEALYKLSLCFILSSILLSFISSILQLIQLNAESNTTIHSIKNTNWNLVLNIITNLFKRKNLMLSSLQKADRLIVPTKLMKNLFELNGVKQEIILLPYGIEPVEARLQNEKKSFRQNGKTIFGFIGHIAPTKAPDLVIKAFNLIDSKKHNCELHIYGKLKENDKYCDLLKELAKENSNIYFKGSFPPNEIYSILNTIDCIVVPSTWYENLPLVLLSALQAKVPSIVSNVGGLTEVVENNVNGLTFEAGNYKDLSRCLKKVIDEPETLITFSRNIQSPSSISTYTEKLENLYKTLLINN